MSESTSQTEATPENSDSTYWHLRTGDKEIGPIMMSRLRQMGRQGKITPADLVRKGKTGDWVPAGTVPGLLIAAPAPAPVEKEEEELPSLPPAPGPFARLMGAMLGGGADLFDGGLAFFAG